jgi:hypothetical protein
MKTQMQRTHLEAMRHQLIECATTRPADIKAFYDKHLVYVDGCSFLDSDTPKFIGLLFRGKLKHFESELVPFLLSGVDPYGQRKCGLHDCMNPQHIKQL